MEDITIRKVTMQDIPDIVKQRRLMFEAMGFKDPENLQLVEKASYEYFEKLLTLNEFHGWVAVTQEGKIVCNAGIIIDQHPPGPSNLSGKVAYIFNLYTLVDYRGRGIATEVMKTLLEWIKKEGIDVSTLHATDAGERIYKRLNFRPSRQMYLNLSK